MIASMSPSPKLNPTAYTLVALEKAVGPGRTITTIFVREIVKNVLWKYSIDSSIILLQLRLCYMDI